MTRSGRILGDTTGIDALEDIGKRVVVEAAAGSGADFL